MNKLLTLAFCAVLLSFSAKSQNYKGIWHGFITAEGQVNKSQYAVNIKTQEGNIITGKTYIYNDFIFVFYGVLDFIGTIDGQTVKITELRLGEYQIPFNTLCLKFANLGYTKKAGEELLSGIWNNQQGSCPVGDAVLKKFVPGKIDPQISEEFIRKIAEDKSSDIKFRETILTKPFVLNITKPTITLEIRDYLKEDNDTVSVFVNREEVISKRRITHKVYKKTVRFNKLSGLNEIIVYANNLGRVPPNTCVMIIDDGNTKQRVNIFSSYQSSAVIYLNYKPIASRPGATPNDQFKDDLKKANKKLPQNSETSKIAQVFKQ